MSADLDALVEQMFAPATRLACAVRDADLEESHAVLSPLDDMSKNALCVALAALVPVDSPLNDLLAWRRADEESLAAKVRSRRRAYGLTQGQLAEVVGVTRNTIGKIENGSVPHAETIALLEDGFRRLGSSATATATALAYPGPQDPKIVEENP